MAAALWDEIQRRYGFTGLDPYDPDAFAGPVGGFWLATGPESDDPVGSIALTPLSDGAAELDVMYVTTGCRGSGVAQGLLAVLERHARAAGITVVRLRAGEPQPEALRFYLAAGFSPIAPFGRWVGDDTARCFEKALH
jgi:putative acetyltransferase